MADETWLIRIARHLAFPFVGVLLFWSIFSSSASAEEAYRFERMWPAIQQPWYFSEPPDVAVDRDGFVYVVDRFNHRIQKFTAGGQFVTRWGKQGSAAGELSFPDAACVDLDGSVYVIDGGNNRIQKYGPDGRFLLQWGTEGSAAGAFLHPSGIDVDSEGNVYVADRGNDRIQKFSPSGAYLAGWGEAGSDIGQFDSPSDVAVDRQGGIWVADSGNQRVQKFTSEGEYAGGWGKEVPLENGAEYWRPQTLALDPEGNLYIFDSSTQRILNFSKTGDYLRQFGKEGSGGDGEFMSGSGNGMAVGKDGTVYAADTAADRIHLFTPDGVFKGKWGSIGNGEGEFGVYAPSAIGIGPDGSVYTIEWFNREQVQKFSPDGLFLTRWGKEAVLNGGFDFNSASGIGVDSTGRVFVADRLNHRIIVFSADGSYLFSWGEKGDQAGEFNGPRDIAASPDGSLYVVDEFNARVQKFTAEGNFLLEWGSFGFGQGQFEYPAAVAVGPTGVVYVSDDLQKRVQRFTDQGVFLGEWGYEGLGIGDGGFAFDATMDLAVDEDGNVYVADTGNACIQVFDPEGNFLGAFGNKGSDVGQFLYPEGVAAGPDDRICVIDSGNHRVQCFQKMVLDSRSKAIVVAGGGPFPGNNLWDATQANANFAYRTLRYQGYAKEDIHYLSANTDMDLDGNGFADDVAGDATVENLEAAITVWAADADRLILYLVDHGGDRTFRMSAAENLTAADLDNWLDQFQTAAGASVILVYDACRSGSFVGELLPPPDRARITLSSTRPEESALFIDQGTISFSYFFWSHVFNGMSLGDAFTVAADSLQLTSSGQNPQLDTDGDGIGNEAADDIIGAQSVYIGNGTAVQGAAPEIVAVSPSRTIVGENAAPIVAEGVADPDGVVRVWAVIRPPSYDVSATDNPLKGLPSVELAAVGDGRHEGAYSGFHTAGTYTIAVYAQDRLGNTSAPMLTSVVVESPLRRRVVIVAGGDPADDVWPAVEAAVKGIYQAVRFQGYAEEDIYFLSPKVFAEGWDGAATLANIAFGLDQWADAGTRDLFVCLVGPGGVEEFYLSGGENLSATQLDLWLDELQARVPGVCGVFYDGSRSGSFLEHIAPPAGKLRVNIASAAGDETAYFQTGGAVSFSNFFWSRILNGADLYQAYLHARSAMRISFRNQRPVLDDSGNGIGGEKRDGAVARYIFLGSGVMLAADDPVIGDYSGTQAVSGGEAALIWAANVNGTAPIERVWAVVSGPVDDTGGAGTVAAPHETDLEHVAGTGRYEASFSDFPLYGTYTAAIFAKDADGNLSMPVETIVVREDGQDVYEDDDTAVQASIIPLNAENAQRHNFYGAADEDWVAFYALAGQSYQIHVDNPDPGCDPVVQLYGEGGGTPVSAPENAGSFGEKEGFSWPCPADGIYYARIGPYPENAAPVTAPAGYDLRVSRAIGGDIGTIRGRLLDADGIGMDGVVIRSNSNADPAITFGGGYFRAVLPAGVHLLSADLPGGNEFHREVGIEAEEMKVVQFSLVPVKGDVSGDYVLDLTDATIALQVLGEVVAGGQRVREDYALAGVDVDGDARVGMPEVIYTLQMVSELR